MKWGIYDTKDHCWLGDERGPKLFDDDDPMHKGNAFPIARAAAELADIQMGWPPKRSVARRYDLTSVQKKDELPIKRTATEALRGKETGKYL